MIPYLNHTQILPADEESSFFSDFDIEIEHPLNNRILELQQRIQVLNEDRQRLKQENFVLKTMKKPNFRDLKNKLDMEKDKTVILEGKVRELQMKVTEQDQVLEKMKELVVGNKRVNISESTRASSFNLVQNMQEYSIQTPKF